ncbi:MAG TPA: DUF2127 domain-containing protein [Candidatus Angelobacter sp.]|jgi:uncharacterized membrane protein (DUF2068 family)|nr:DUF2127 domain-containing protein [Candidatus Angelobacter sp.]
MNTEKNLIARHFGLRGIALFEAAKGLIGLAVVIWLLSLLHSDLESVASHLLHFLHKSLHLSPDGHIARSIMRGASRVTHGNLLMFAGLAFLYVTVRFVEATGLWLEKEWAEWLALVSGAMYMPYEMYELARHATLIKWGILASNALIILYMAWLLRDSHRKKKQLQEAAPAKTVQPQEGD